MHDPWDVASTRRSDQYVSCMKISGVPLLPPVISKECRKEMQYYKILALEVEKRISHLKGLVADLTSDNDDSNSFNEVSEDIVKITHDEKHIESNCPNTCETSLVSNGYESLRSDVTVIDNSDNSPVLSSPKLVIDVIGDLFKDSLNDTVVASKETLKEEEPERDYNCLPCKLMTGAEMTETKVVETDKQNGHSHASMSTIVNEKQAQSPSKYQSNGPPSLTNSKSVDDIHAELSFLPKLTRQRSYTILKPSAALLAHLEVQSLNSGVEMSAISMSESCSNISWLTKKRRSWDLETAKVKWSSMATELNKGVKKNIPQKKTHIGRPNIRAQTSQQIVRARSTTQENRRCSTSNNTPKNQVQKIAPQTNTNNLSSTKKFIDAKPDKLNKTSSPISSNNISLECHSPDEGFTARLSMITSNDSRSQSPSPIKSSGSSSPKEDPSACIKELYDKIRTQQMIRMASLLEKQKKEKNMLQQVFEEQNALFYKQLKTICPTSPKKVKEAWAEKTPAKDSSPVRLSQLINSGAKSHTSSEVASAVLNDSQSYIQKTDDALKKSRNVLLGVKGSQNSKTKPKSSEYTSSPYAAAAVRPRSMTSNIPKREEKLARTITDSSSRYTSQSPRRRLNSNNSQSSRDVEPILTDRTNDTMADLNFTLPNDDNADLCSDALYRDYNTTFIMSDGRKDHSIKSTVAQCPIKSPPRCRTMRSGSIDSATDGSLTLREYSVHSSKNQINSQSKSMRKLFSDKPPGPREIEAASRIVAHAKGYLVRRLLRTERVQATVQTIRDALICALQLHQDREGIRGADVDLHRRLIQQITAACYSLHETFIVSSPQDRCALISQDRDRQRALEEKQMSGSFSLTKSLATPTRRSSKRKTDRDVMSHSHSGVFVAGRACRLPHYAMTQSSHEMYSSEDKSHRPSSKKSVAASKELHSRRPWR